MWTVWLLLAVELAVACGEAAEPPARSIGVVAAGAAGAVPAGAPAVSGRTGSAGSSVFGGVAGASAPAGPAGAGSPGGAAVGMAGGASVVPPPRAGSTAPTPSAGAAAAPVAAAGAGAARPLAMRSAGCGKPAGMTGAFQAQIRAFELDRGYFISVPKTYDPERAHRLVFGYHGSNYTGMRMRQYLDNEKAPLLDGTIFVYPDGLPLPNQPDHIAWELKANGRDLAFFDALFQHVRDTYCIDETRVFVNGQSYGALMTNYVGCMRGDVVRAIAVVAGSGPRGATCTGKVAVWMTHGMEDMNVSFASGEASRNFWISANGCMMTTVPGMPAQCQVYQGCDPEHSVTWCPHMNDGGHQHPSFGRAAVR